MGAEAFLSGLWAASLSGAVIVAAVALARPLFQDRTPRAAFCALWDAALVRLLVWGEWTSPVSIRRWGPALFPVSAANAETAAPVLTLPLDGVVLEGAAVPGGEAVSPLFPLDRDSLLLLLWLAAALLLAGRFLWVHWRSRRVYGASLPCEDGFVRQWLASRRLRRPLRVRTSDRIAAPLTYGVLRPVILLPAGAADLDKGALSCILEHEYAHIRRFDTLRKALLAAALCLHWFNPAVWALYVLSGREMELACDEAVTDRGADRARYARTLLDLEERRGQWGLSGSHFSRNALEERIKAMMRKKQRSLTAALLLAAVICVTVTVFASAAPEEAVPVTVLPREVTDLPVERGSTETSHKGENTSTKPSEPTEAEVLAARNRALAGMTAEQIEDLTETVKTGNLYLEQEYLWNNLFGKLADPESLYWNYFHQTGEIQIGWALEGDVDIEAICGAEGLTEQEVYALYGTPVVHENPTDAGDWINRLGELEAAVQNEALKAELRRLTDDIVQARDTHRMEYVNDLYKRFHDLDYYLLRYGPTDVGPYVRDMSTISKYYGMLALYD